MAKYRCPKCGGTTFCVDAHVVQGWLVDGDGRFLETTEEWAEKMLVGEREYGKTVDVTDPCRRRASNLRENDIKICPGTYQCIMWIDHRKYVYRGMSGVDSRVAVLGIYKDGEVPEQDSMVEIGEIFVDSGTAGIFDAGFELDEDGYDDYCSSMNTCEFALMRDDGVCSYSGNGDGGYGVYAYRAPETGEITALELWFLI